MDQLSKSLLEKVFKANLVNPKGISAKKFRAEHHKALDLLDGLESAGYLEKRDDKYKVALFVLVDLLDSVTEVKDLLNRCDYIFQVLQQHYTDHLGESISLNDLSIISSLPREDINIALSYMIEAPIFGGWTIDFCEVKEAKITPSEPILRYKKFGEVLDTMRSWRSERLSVINASEVQVDRSANKIIDKKALLRKLEELYGMKEVKDGFPTQQACLDWSNRVAPLLKFNEQYYTNFVANSHKMNLRLSSFTLEPALNIMVSQLQMAIAELKNNIETGHDANGMGDKIASYIDETRIKELKRIQNKKFDLTKLVRILEEINLCNQKGCYLATIMLVRALLDHVPPIFGCKSFSEFANNYKGQRSFKKSMQNLENSSRDIANQHLHCQIRVKEVLPNKTQVNFSPDIDVLLAEIVRIFK